MSSYLFNSNKDLFRVSVLLKNITHDILQIKFQLNNSNVERIRPVLKQLFLETFQYKRSLRYQTINLLWVSVWNPSKFSVWNGSFATNLLLDFSMISLTMILRCVFQEWVYGRVSNCEELVWSVKGYGGAEKNICI